MLFSNEAVAAIINASFEPVWVSVRPVPIVHVDFGAGQLLTRTLHGNIATYVCDHDGNILDVLPGIYEPDAYAKRLSDFVLLHRWFYQKQRSPDALKEFHAAQAQALINGEQPLELAPKRADFTKSFRIEGPFELVLRPSTSDHSPAAGTPSERGRKPEKTSRQSLLESLTADTLFNETTRRQMIHRRLAAKGPVPVDQLARWLYRDVLHADLDDPYLGLGDLLLATDLTDANDSPNRTDLQSSLPPSTPERMR